MPIVTALNNFLLLVYIVTVTCERLCLWNCRSTNCPFRHPMVWFGDGASSFLSVVSWESVMSISNERRGPGST